jgi:hypothetical protein
VRLSTVLDLVGCLALLAGIVLFVAQWTIPGALGVSGAGLLALSWLVDRKGKR